MKTIRSPGREAQPEGEGRYERAARLRMARTTSRLRLIVQAQRGLHPVWVFPFCGHRMDSMNNTGWQNARRAVGLERMRVHDLRHTYACRVRAAGVRLRTVRRCSATPSTRCQGTTRAPMSGDSSGWPISC